MFAASLLYTVESNLCTMADSLTFKPEALLVQTCSQIVQWYLVHTYCAPSALVEKKMYLYITEIIRKV